MEKAEFDQLLELAARNAALICRENAKLMSDKWREAARDYGEVYEAILYLELINKLEGKVDHPYYSVSLQFPCSVIDRRMKSNVDVVFDAEGVYNNDNLENKTLIEIKPIWEQRKTDPNKLLKSYTDAIGSDLKKLANIHKKTQQTKLVMLVPYIGPNDYGPHAEAFAQFQEFSNENEITLVII